MLLLHLSDIHLRKGEVGTAMDPNAHLRSELLRDAAAQCELIGAVPDAVLVSGDVAFAGDPEEYAYGLSWLDELCRSCRTPLSSVFVIPGNHDVLRSVVSRTLIQTVVSLLTAVCFIAAAEASATGVAAPQSQAGPSAPKPSTIDIIRQPSLLRQKLAGNNCQTTCQWIGGRQFCNTYCF